MTTVSAHATSVLGDAFEEISSVIKANEAAGFSSTSLLNTYEVALAIDEKLATKGRIRNMIRLRAFFDGIERYAKAMEPLCNGTPFLPWIW
ncbi:MAG: hypothetical protein LQ340_006869, partial [Diploschistes diacapsis]